LLSTNRHVGSMRVLIAPEWYPWPDCPLYGLFCQEQARAVARVADVTVLTWRLDPTLKAPFRLEVADEDGLSTLRVRFARGHLPKTTSGFRLTGCVFALARLRRRGWTPDVIHAHQYVAAPVALSLGALARAPVIFTEHYSGFRTLPKRERRRAKRAFERANVVCPVSEELAQHVRAVAPRAKLEPVPNVVDTDVFTLGALRTPATPPRLATVGSFIERKGHRHLLAALARLREDGTTLTLDIVGDGPLRPDLEAVANDLGVEDLITFHGEKPKTAVAAILRRADVFVLPSLWENLPCALLEAMSTGLPVVATHVGGVPEVVDSHQGILVAPGSSDALADALGQMVLSIAEYDRRQLRAQAVSRFGYVAIAGRWANIYATARAAHRDGAVRNR
jgi:glycosyltransferase involved in cell wall biosynthesis